MSSLSCWHIFASKRFLNQCRSFSSMKTLLCSSKPLTQFDVNEDNKATSPTERQTKFRRINNRENFERLAEYRFTYPEFLPDARYEFRNNVREKLERADMLKRRVNIIIPEFYVGSILAVTTSDPYAPGKENRFVGICINRTYLGLRATFVLRNIVDNQGIEIIYDMYNPTIQKIEVLRLEKRLDETLYYLRDAPPQYSTFSFDMEQEFVAEGAPVPLNPLKVKLNPKPWRYRYYLKQLKGLEIPDEYLNEFDRRTKEKADKPWEAYDMMKQYRRVIPEEDQVEIWKEVDSHRQLFQMTKQKWKQRVLQKAPVKSGTRSQT